jgi:DNA ligase
MKIIKKLSNINDTSLFLEKLHTYLISNKVSIDDVLEVIHTRVVPLVSYYISKGSSQPLENFNDEERQNIFMMIEILQFIYNNSGENTGISDVEFDKLYELYYSFGNDDIIGASLNTKVNIDTHKYPRLRGTLEKVYYLSDTDLRTNPSRKYLSSWIRKCEKLYYEKTGNTIDLSDIDVIIFPKWDGVSCVFEYDDDGNLIKALTRGDVLTNEAQNITHIFKNTKMNHSNYGFSTGVKTEVVMTKENFSMNNDNNFYKNPRSMVSGILNSEDVTNSNLLTVIKLRYMSRDTELENLDPEVFDYKYLECKISDIGIIREFANSNRVVNGINCDGVVIRIHDDMICRILGRDSNKNNYEVAYKYTEEVSLTKITDVDFQLGNNGYITPIARVEPVNLKQTTITNVSLGSINRFNELNLGKGDTVKILYDVVPYLVFDNDCKHKSKSKKFDMIYKCPYCDTMLDLNDDGLPCKCNNINCEWKKKGMILNYIIKMGIPNIGARTIEKLYNNDIINSIDDLYDIHKKKSDIIKVNGFSDKSSTILIESINSIKTIEDYKLLSSLGINSIGIESFRNICKEYTIKDLLTITANRDYESLMKIAGIKEKKAIKVIEGLLAVKNTLLNISRHLNIIHPTSFNEKFSVAFTKVRDTNIEDMIIKLGGCIHENVKRNTTYLVVPDKDTNSTKVEKAIEYGVRIIPIKMIIGTIERDFS